jgi:RNA polymerase sigma-70 factor (ECF subfamily)
MALCSAARRASLGQAFVGHRALVPVTALCSTPSCLSPRPFMPGGSPSDQDLIDRAREGDRWAFRRLVERYEDQVAATVVGMLGPGAEADDVGQETFVRFYEALDQYRGEAGLGTYLTRIAINQSLKAVRRRKRWGRRFFSRDDDTQSLPEPAVDGADAVESRERAEFVHAALQNLSADHRAVVVLRLLKGYSTREAADVLDVPEGTVMSRLYRATDRLQDMLQPYVDL